MPIMISPQALGEAIEQGYRRLEAFRDHRQTAGREYAGRWYGDDDAEKRPLNLVNHAVSVLLPHVCPTRLGFKIRAKRLSLSMESEVLTLAMNNLGKEIRLLQTIRDCVTDAILGPIGLARCGIKAGDKLVTINDNLVNAGQFYCERIDLDDYSVDPSARDYREAYWESYRVRVPRVLALEGGIYNPEMIERLPIMTIQRHNYEYGSPQEELSGQRNSEAYELVEMIELEEVIVYEGGGDIYEVTIPSSPGHATEFLSVRTWEGPERGPMVRLAYNRVPNNIMPLPMVSKWRDLAGALNALARKAMASALQSKQILVAGKDAEDDAVTVRDAADREVVIVDDPSSIKNVEIGGIHRDHLPFLEQGMQWWNLVSGNLNMLGGTSSQKTDTATEFQGLQGNLSTLMKDTVYLTDAFKQEIGEHMLWELVHDPLIDKPYPMRIPGGEFIEVTYSPESREGDFMDFGAEVEPTVPAKQDPMTRARRIIELGQMIPQWAQTEAITQGRISLAKWLHIMAREFEMPELDEVSMDPMVQQMNEMAFQGIRPPEQGMPTSQWQGNQQAVDGRMQIGNGQQGGQRGGPGRMASGAGLAQNAGASRVPA